MALKMLSNLKSYQACRQWYWSGLNDKLLMYRNLEDWEKNKISFSFYANLSHVSTIWGSKMEIAQDDIKYCCFGFASSNDAFQPSYI